MQKLDGKSLDLVAENSKALVEALGKVVPEVVSEGVVDLDKLAILLGKDKDMSGNLERYNFSWPDKRKAIKSALQQSTGTLRPAPSESVNWDNTQNLYIEGDNLEVLKLLQKSYFNKVKMIYIDPPYNTGKEFVYPDDYADNIQNYLEITGQINESGRRITTNAETSGRYHTNWLNMMYPRLKLARNLLREDGVIFISIDDNEVTNLRKLCDEIFGEENFVGTFSRITKKAGKSSSFISKNHDYFLCFFKSSNSSLIRLKHNDFGFSNEDEFLETRGKFKLNQTLDYDTLGYIPSLDYEIKINGESFFPGGVTREEFEKRKKEKPKDGFRWRWSKRMFDFGEKNGFIVVKKGKNGKRIYTKTYLLASIEFDNNNYFIEYADRTKAISTIDFLSNEYSNDNSKKDLDALFENKKVFEYSKPVSLLNKILKISTQPNDIILDFFSGSATTAHAVMELNKEDGGNRQFIMVQLPEPCDENSEAFKAGYKNICEIGKERIRRVIKKIEAEYEEAENSSSDELDLGDNPVKSKPDLGFKVFKLDSSNFIPWDNNPDNLSEESLQRSLSNIKLDRSQQDLLYELFIKLGVTLNTPYQKIKLGNKYFYDIGYGSIYACLDDDLDMDFCNAMIEYHDNQFPKEEAKNKTEEKALEKYRLETTTFIFRDSSFKDDNIKTNILQTLRQKGLENIRAI